MNERHHISVDVLERYHLGTVEEPELTTIEANLLWCHECQDRAEALAPNLATIWNAGNPANHKAKTDGHGPTGD